MSDVLVFDELDSLISDVLRDFAYKPGWTFTAYVARNTRRLGVTVSVDAFSCRTGKALDLQHKQGSQRTVKPENVEERLLNLLRDAIRQVELHEMDEWCTYKGRRLWDPHLK